MNELVDILEKESSAAKDSPQSSSPEKVPNGPVEPLANGVRKEPPVTLVHKNFQVTELTEKCLTIYACLPSKIQSIVIIIYLQPTQGILTNETRCLRCEIVTARDETFFDLSVDIEQNSSITSCLKNFCSTETLNAEDKFFCDKCCRYNYTIFPFYCLFFLSSCSLICFDLLVCFPTATSIIAW